MNNDILKEIDSIINGYFTKLLTENEAVFLLGPPNSGKTTYINRNIKGTHIIIDASEIYKQLNKGSSNGFTKKLVEDVNYIGTEILRKAISQKKSFVIEFQLDQYEYIIKIVNRLKKIGYKVSGLHLDCTKDEAMKRALKRDKNNVSSYFTENNHIAWFIEVLDLLFV
jgi:predicted kinase